MSKELEALENIKHYDSRVGLHESDYDLVETALKALKIIKEKKVYPQRLLMWRRNLSFYNAEMPEDRQLTEEEFKILIEALSNDE